MLPATPSRLSNIPCLGRWAARLALVEYHGAEPRNEKKAMAHLYLKKQYEVRALATGVPTAPLS